MRNLLRLIQRMRIEISPFLSLNAACS